MDLQVWKPAVWAAFRARALTRSGRDVLLTLATFRGRDGSLYPSHASLARRAECCVRTVRTALSDAREAGLVSWASGRRRRTSNRYSLEMPRQTHAGRVPCRIERLAIRAARTLVGNWHIRGEHQHKKSSQSSNKWMPAVSGPDRVEAAAALATVARRRRAEREAVWVQRRIGHAAVSC